MAELDAIKAVALVVRNVTGMLQSPDYPEGSLFPAAFTYLGPGEIVIGSPTGRSTELFTIAVELHVINAGDRYAAQEQLETLHPLIVAALKADVTFGGKLQQYNPLSFSGAVEGSIDAIKTLARVYTLNNCKIIS
jgi:hypothetical protein